MNLVHMGRLITLPGLSAIIRAAEGSAYRAVTGALESPSVLIEIGRSLHKDGFTEDEIAHLTRAAYQNCDQSWP
jgi:hypothetical protein